MKKQKLSTQPVKGFRDFVPEDWQLQQYIFNTWKKVCRQYGYEEYSGPILERVEIYNKSGDEVGTGGKELYSFTDKGGRNLAMRPEMTPTVGRMIAAYGKKYPKPIRWFSIEQFFRAEKPQRGRGREFYQLNVDIFGDDSTKSDLEIINLSIDIMLAFRATQEMFEVRINNRKFTEYYFEKVLNLADAKTKDSILKIIDASPKRGGDWVKKSIENLNAGISYENIKRFLSLSLEDVQEYTDDNEGAKELVELFQYLESTGLVEYCVFDTTMTRGLDYYDGMVFEVFDKNPKNNRSLFGGGRYNNLLDVFGNEKMPAVGVAPGDMTTTLFLESWNLLDTTLMSESKITYIPLLDEFLYEDIQKIATQLRAVGQSVIAGFSVQGVSDSLREANKKGYTEVVLYGEEEKKKGVYVIKDMESNEQEEVVF